jgi:hypothetical protein
MIRSSEPFAKRRSMFVPHAEAMAALRSRLKPE